MNKYHYVSPTIIKFYAGLPHGAGKRAFEYHRLHGRMADYIYGNGRHVAVQEIFHRQISSPHWGA